MHHYSSRERWNEQDVTVQVLNDPGVIYRDLLHFGTGNAQVALQYDLISKYADVMRALCSDTTTDCQNLGNVDADGVHTKLVDASLTTWARVYAHPNSVSTDNVANTFATLFAAAFGLMFSSRATRSAPVSVAEHTDLRWVFFSRPAVEEMQRIRLSTGSQVHADWQQIARCLMGDETPTANTFVATLTRAMTSHQPDALLCGMTYNRDQRVPTVALAKKLKNFERVTGVRINLSGTSVTIKPLIESLRSTSAEKNVTLVNFMAWCYAMRVPRLNDRHVLYRHTGSNPRIGEIYNRVDDPHFLPASGALRQHPWGDAASLTDDDMRTNMGYMERVGRLVDEWFSTASARPRPGKPVLDPRTPPQQGYLVFQRQDFYSWLRDTNKTMTLHDKLLDWEWATVGQRGDQMFDARVLLHPGLCEMLLQSLLKHLDPFLSLTRPRGRPSTEPPVAVADSDTVLPLLESYARPSSTDRERHDWKAKYSQIFNGLDVFGAATLIKQAPDNMAMHAPELFALARVRYHTEPAKVSKLFDEWIKAQETTFPLKWKRFFQRHAAAIRNHLIEPLVPAHSGVAACMREVKSNAAGTPDDACSDLKRFVLEVISHVRPQHQFMQIMHYIDCTGTPLPHAASPPLVVGGGGGGGGDNADQLRRDLREANDTLRQQDNYYRQALHDQEQEWDAKLEAAKQKAGDYRAGWINCASDATVLKSELDAVREEHDKARDELQRLQTTAPAPSASTPAEIAKLEADKQRLENELQASNLNIKDLTEQIAAADDLVRTTDLANNELEKQLTQQQKEVASTSTELRQANSELKAAQASVDSLKQQLQVLQSSGTDNSKLSELQSLLNQAVKRAEECETREKGLTTDLKKAITGKQAIEQQLEDTKALHKTSSENAVKGRQTIADQTAEIAALNAAAGQFADKTEAKDAEIEVLTAAAAAAKKTLEELGAQFQGEKEKAATEIADLKADVNTTELLVKELKTQKRALETALVQEKIASRAANKAIGAGTDLAAGAFKETTTKIATLQTQLASSNASAVAAEAALQAQAGKLADATAENAKLTQRVAQLEALSTSSGALPSFNQDDVAEAVETNSDADSESDAEARKEVFFDLEDTQAAQSQTHEDLMQVITGGVVPVVRQATGSLSPLYDFSLSESETNSDSGEPRSVSSVSRATSAASFSSAIDLDMNVDESATLTECSAHDSTRLQITINQGEDLSYVCVADADEVLGYSRRLAEVSMLGSCETDQVIEPTYQFPSRPEATVVQRIVAILASWKLHKLKSQYAGAHLEASSRNVTINAGSVTSVVQIEDAIWTQKDSIDFDTLRVVVTATGADTPVDYALQAALASFDDPSAAYAQIKDLHNDASTDTLEPVPASGTFSRLLGGSGASGRSVKRMLLACYMRETSHCAVEVCTIRTGADNPRHEVYYRLIELLGPGVQPGDWTKMTAPTTLCDELPGTFRYFTDAAKQMAGEASAYEKQMFVGGRGSFMPTDDWERFFDAAVDVSFNSCSALAAFSIVVSAKARWRVWTLVDKPVHSVVGSVSRTSNAFCFADGTVGSSKEEARRYNDAHTSMLPSWESIDQLSLSLLCFKTAEPTKALYQDSKNPDQLVVAFTIKESSGPSLPIFLLCAQPDAEHDADMQEFANGAWYPLCNDACNNILLTACHVAHHREPLAKIVATYQTLLRDTEFRAHFNKGVSTLLEEKYIEGAETNVVNAVVNKLALGPLWLKIDAGQPTRLKQSGSDEACGMLIVIETGKGRNLNQIRCYPCVQAESKPEFTLATADASAPAPADASLNLATDPTSLDLAGPLNLYSNAPSPALSESAGSTWALVSPDTISATSAPVSTEIAEPQQREDVDDNAALQAAQAALLANRGKGAEVAAEFKDAEFAGERVALAAAAAAAKKGDMPQVGGNVQIRQHQEELQQKRAAAAAAAAEQERLEQERLAAEEAERAAAAAAAEAKAKEEEEAKRAAAAAEQERIEQERMAAEEAERAAAAAAAAAEQERIEKERLAAEEAERIEKERLAAEEAERVEQERLAAEEAERAAAAAAAAAEQERLEQERLAAAKIQEEFEWHASSSKTPSGLGDDAVYEFDDGFYFKVQKTETGETEWSTFQGFDAKDQYGDFEPWDAVKLRATQWRRTKPTDLETTWSKGDDVPKDQQQNVYLILTNAYPEYYAVVDGDVVFDVTEEDGVDIEEMPDRDKSKGDKTWRVVDAETGPQKRMHAAYTAAKEGEYADRIKAFDEKVATAAAEAKTLQSGTHKGEVSRKTLRYYDRNKDTTYFMDIRGYSTGTSPVTFTLISEIVGASKEDTTVAGNLLSLKRKTINDAVVLKNFIVSRTLDYTKD